jgi:aspartyl-tRNA(Asn)/glutamyl-tRNA(Gln) amidotransferase subunit C
MIDRKTVEYIAELARLELTEDEKGSCAKDLGSILDHIAQLNEVDTEGVEPTSFMVPDHDPLRDDRKTASLPVDETLKNGPMVKKGFFAVPKIIQ